jgi:hypothetical protein
MSERPRPNIKQREPSSLKKKMVHEETQQAPGASPVIAFLEKEIRENLLFMEKKAPQQKRFTKEKTSQDPAEKPPVP